MKPIDILLALSLPSLILLHLVAAPYTKVEESFNIQASHDVLVYGTPTSHIHEKLSRNYDHFSFPGAVPRTFVGPVILAGISQPLVAIFGFEHAQLIVRAVLGLFNAVALIVFSRSVERAFGEPMARWYVLLQASQFHIVFYASRTLPNMFAFGLTTLAFACLLPKPQAQSLNRYHRLAISLFVFAGVIFRSEVALLLGTSTLYLLVMQATSLYQVIPPFIISFVAALVISVPLDSYFWQRPLWPELWGFYYNAVLGSSSNWGVSPWHYYFTSALPRLLLNPLAVVLLIPIALLQPATRRPALGLLAPSLLFVAIYSLQPHKEARFIFYAVPPLTTAAALGANFVFARRAKSAPYALASLVLAASILASFAASAAMLVVSSLNYPGGEALAHLRRLVVADAAASVVPAHADVLACMTGVTLFGAATTRALPARRSGSGTLLGGNTSGGTAAASTLLPSLALDKTEDEAALRDPQFWARFEYLLVEDASKVRGGGPWEPVAVVGGYAGVEVLRPGARASGGPDPEAGDIAPRVGNGALVARVREAARRLTGGWWVGPRMEPRIHILRRVRKETDRGQQVRAAAS